MTAWSMCDTTADPDLTWQLQMAAMPSPPLSLESEKIERFPWHRFSFSKLLGRNDPISCPIPQPKQQPPTARPGLGRRLSRKVVPGLPRPATFRRQNSERRDRLTPVQPSVTERRAVSVERRRALSARPASPPPVPLPKHSAPEVRDLDDGYSSARRGTCPDIPLHDTENHQHLSPPQPPPPPPPLPPADSDSYADEPAPSEGSCDNEMDDETREELDKKWILNLSMHFRDHSPREKFFLTYAEEAHRWRRVTVSCDYRDAPPHSLEKDLQALQFQRDKSARIYESIRMSLPDIQFYDTVTNLKLETRDDRLHVHVTEDVNEIIPYPPVSMVEHLDCMFFKESELNFEAHMSGFVYKVRVHEQVWIKKEIPGPDSVDEFLYEINALDQLIGSQSVIQFKGLVVDEGHSVVKGLLIGFAEQGALVDILYDNRGQLPWGRREKWARQIIQGLSEIHEAGFVQGDFTLSNIVIDEEDDAKIIDINRRGCPVGWEPPEISKLIERGQRISMYIGVKSDLFQLGMVLWGLATEEDEPERQPRPLTLQPARDPVPQYYCEVATRCLNHDPKQRLSAKDLLRLFPFENGTLPRAPSTSDHCKHPNNALVGDFDSDATSSKNGDVTQGHYAPADGLYSNDMPFDRPGSFMDIGRGRRPPADATYLSPLSRSRQPSATQSDSCDPQIVPISPTGENRWGEVEVGGTPYIVQRGYFPYADLDGAGGGPATAGFAHVDSGLADMDLLAGVGEHETLRDDAKYRSGGNTPRGTTREAEAEGDEIRLEDHDNHGTHGMT